MRATEHVTLGKKQVKLTTPSHVPGVRGGNEPHGADGARGSSGKVPATRSTGINADARAPIDPASPKLTPA